MARRFKRWCKLTGGVVILLLAASLVAHPVLAAPVTRSGAAQAQDWRCVEINGTLALNIRSGPGVNYDVVGTLSAGTELEGDYAAVTAADGYNWLAVRYTDGEGWAITVRLAPCPGDSAGSGSGDSDSGGETRDDSGGETTTVLDSVNRDGTLDRFEIEEVAHSVVLIANVRGSRIRATGTGTIPTPDGLIVTNAHVVEDADRVALGILDDINDPPEYLYMGEIVSVDEEIDVALIAIRYDMDGRPVDAADLHLPFIPSTLHPEDVFRGDAIYIFGYPGIGDDFMVVTTGSIVSVENGDMDGQRLPVWYRTDAEIAPGSSGGLVVNGNGEFVGIPTFVQTEEETGGRLGGIRPAEVALMAVMDEQYGALNTATTNAVPAKVPGAIPGVAFTVEDVRLDHGAVRDDQVGIAFHVAFAITGWAEQTATVSVRVFHDDMVGAPVINQDAPPRYRDPDGVVMVSVPILPCCDETVYDDLPLFLPYDVLGFAAAGTYPLKIEIAVTGDDSWRRVLSWEFVTYTRD